MRILLAVIFAVVTNGFGIVPSTLPKNGLSKSTTPLFMSDEPSDTSSDSSDVLTIDNEPYVPTEGEALVTKVMDQLNGITGSEISSETRSAINEALLKLERMNPTENPTMSPLLNGVWELKYATGYASDWALPSPTRQLALFLYSGGYSPGLYALSLAQSLPSNLVSVGDLEIAISRDQPRIEAKVDVTFLGMSSQSVIVKARLDVQSGVRFNEVYESASVMGTVVDLPTQVQYSRDLYITYVDEDLLVVRDASGVPEVLIRKVFVNNWGTEPNALDDMVPPGNDGTDLPATD